MKNKILLATIFVIPIGLFTYFWCDPVSEKKPAAPENKISQNAVGTSNSPTPSDPPALLPATNVPPPLF